MTSPTSGDFTKAERIDTWLDAVAILRRAPKSMPDVQLLLAPYLQDSRKHRLLCAVLVEVALSCLYTWAEGDTQRIDRLLEKTALEWAARDWPQPGGQGPEAP